jgi:hypothetical protein
MLTDFISITALQRNLKSIFASKKPMHVVLSNNAVTGIVLSKEASKLLLDSGVLEQLREELWELHDKDTADLVTQSRSGKTKPVPFASFASEHGV